MYNVQIDFSNIFNMIDEWCELNGISKADFIEFYEEVSNDSQG